MIYEEKYRFYIYEYYTNFNSELAYFKIIIIIKLNIHIKVTLTSKR